MKHHRNGSAKNNSSKQKNYSSSYEQYLVAKRSILAGETESVIELLKSMLETTSRLSASLELCYYYFQKQEVEEFYNYYQLLKKEEKDPMILNQIKQLELYLKINVLHEKLNRNIYPYEESQIIHYEKEDLYKHLKAHRFPKDKQLEDNKFLYFWNMYELVEEIEDNLHLNYKINNYDPFNYYYMLVEKNGIVNGKVTSAIEIKTMKDTFHIVDLKPSSSENHRRLLIPISPIKLTMQD